MICVEIARILAWSCERLKEKEKLRGYVRLSPYLLLLQTDREGLQKHTLRFLILFPVHHEKTRREGFLMMKQDVEIKQNLYYRCKSRKLRTSFRI